MWLKLDVNISNDPKIDALPIGARWLYVVILCRTKTSGRNGILGDWYATPQYWSRQVGAPPRVVESWLIQLADHSLITWNTSGVIIPNWDKYQTDPTAKKRKAEFIEKSAKRNDLGTDQERCGNGVAPFSDRSGTVESRAEQIRAEKIPHTPKGDSDFEEFWTAYPRKKAKGAARKAWLAAKDRPDLQTILAAVDAQRRSKEWTKDGGQFIPHPATWIRAERWLDAVGTETAKPDTDYLTTGFFND